LLLARALYLGARGCLAQRLRRARGAGKPGSDWPNSAFFINLASRGHSTINSSPPPYAQRGYLKPIFDGQRLKD
jgi:hypothetical protein